MSKKFKLAETTPRLLGPALFLLMISVFSILCKWPIWICILGIAIIDLYLLALLFFAAAASDKKTWLLKLLDYLPTRFFGLLLFFSFLVSIVLFFANIYLTLGNEFTPQIKDKFDAIYISFITLTTLGFENIFPQCTSAKAIVMFEFLTAIELFLGSFALIISRLSNF